MQADHETYWVCLNRGCGKTVAYEEAERDLETRACECGSIMKKDTHATVITYLNFLRETPNSETEEKRAEEETQCESRMWSMQPCGERLCWSQEEVCCEFFWG